MNSAPVKRLEHPIRVLLVDDHAIVREGISCLLSVDPEIKVVGETDDPNAAIPLVNQLSPDIVLLDLVLREKHGLDVLKKVRNKCKVVILSMRADELYVAEALHFGASCYLLKESTSNEVLSAIKSVSSGNTYLSSKLRRDRVQQLLRSFDSAHQDPYTRLTPREKTILPLAAEGLTSTEIGERLAISARTVEAHRARLAKKLRLKSQTELVHYAVRKKLVML